MNETVYEKWHLRQVITGFLQDSAHLSWRRAVAHHYKQRVWLTWSSFTNSPGSFASRIPRPPPPAVAWAQQTSQTPQTSQMTILHFASRFFTLLDEALTFSRQDNELRRWTLELAEIQPIPWSWQGIQFHGQFAQLLLLSAQEQLFMDTSYKIFIPNHHPRGPATSARGQIFSSIPVLFITT